MKRFLTTTPRSETYLTASDGSRHLQLAFYTLDKSLITERRDDSGSTNDADSIQHPHTRIECFLSKLFAIFHTKSDIHIGSRQVTHFLDNHLARCGIDGRSTYRNA